jgi:formylglycine-generating enzyme required for sulfatase activity
MSSHSRAHDILPPPFEWIDIPAGEVTLVEEHAPQSYFGYSHKFSVPAFTIAKYPITNAQFAKFIDAGGYADEKWWTDAGWNRNQAKQWTEPQFWQDAQWNSADYPVVGVSWYEALAFCAWLSDISGERVVLPTEQQWQRTAQGDDGREYPWGNEWDAERCNNSDEKDWQKNSTSPVTLYEGKGDSPFTVTDMAGNVLEWTLTAYETGKADINEIDALTLRGGAWDLDHPVYFHVSYRLWYGPALRNYSVGFRIALAR